MTRFKRPSKLRFMWPLPYGAAALFFLWAVDTVQSVICSMGPLQPVACPQLSLPEWLLWAPWLVALWALLVSAHRYWRDFYCGDYYLDYDDPHWRDRW
jgi:hypothetical protein